MVNPAVSVSCQGIHIALGPGMIGLSGRPMSLPQGEFQCWKGDKLPFKESGSALMREMCPAMEHQTFF